MFGGGLFAGWDEVGVAEFFPFVEEAGVDAVDDVAEVVFGLEEFLGFGGGWDGLVEDLVDF